MALGGRAAETIALQSLSTGAADDLQRVTRMAYSLVRLPFLLCLRRRIFLLVCYFLCRG
jgi:hypothetical protein